MKTQLLGIAAVTFVAASMACSDLNPFGPDQSVILGVTELQAPATISAGSSFTVGLIVTVGGCVSFDRIEVERNASYVSLTAMGKDGAKGRTDRVCPQNIQSESHSVQLAPPFSNPFTVEVNRGRLSPLTAVVQVQ